MNKTLAIFIAFAAILSACTKEPKSDAEKYSYSIGAQAAQSILKSELPIDEKMYVQGFQDALNHKPLKLNEQEIQEGLRKATQSTEDALIKLSQENAKKAEGILDVFRKNPDFKTSNSGLMYQIFEKGSGGVSPKDNDFVEIHYTGKFADGKQFDSSRERKQTSRFQLKTVIPAWVEALKMITAGGKMQIVVPPKLGYGSMSNQKIPGNSVLIFDIELIGIQPKP